MGGGRLPVETLCEANALRAQSSLRVHREAGVGHTRYARVQQRVS